MRYILCLVIIFIVAKASCQIRPKDLNGEWRTCNENGEYDKADTVTLHQDINYQYGVKNCCHFINWQIDGKKFKIEKILACTEPGRVTETNSKKTFKLNSLKNGIAPILTLFENGKLTNEFKIIKLEASTINRYPYEVKVLVLKRI